jgi:hypothetical protein
LFGLPACQGLSIPQLRVVRGEVHCGPLPFILPSYSSSSDCPIARRTFPSDGAPLYSSARCALFLRNRCGQQTQGMMIQRQLLLRRPGPARLQARPPQRLRQRFTGFTARSRHRHRHYLARSCQLENAASDLIFSPSVFISDLTRRLTIYVTMRNPHYTHFLSSFTSPSSSFFLGDQPYVSLYASFLHEGSVGRFVSSAPVGWVRVITLWYHAINLCL